MLRKVLAVLGLLLTLPVLGLGAKFLSYWVRTRFGHGWYIPFDYGSEAATWLIWGGLTALCFVAAFLRKKFGGALLLLAGWVSLLLCAIALPSHRIDPLFFARFDSAMKLIEVRDALDAWGRQHGHFPASQAELEAAVKAPAGSAEKANSSFLQDGARLPYRLQYVAGARAPVRAVPAGAAPGTLLCAVGPALDHYWLTVTGLARPAGNEVVLELDSRYLASGVAAMVEGSLAPPPPATPPAKKDK